MIKKYRDNGAIGALLDEYELAINNLNSVISGISDEYLTKIVDENTKDPDCISIQTVLRHVVRAGYNYVIEIRKWMGEDPDFVKVELENTVSAYKKGLDQMFEYNVNLFEDYPNLKLEQIDNGQKINVKWGQQYDVEQLMEHAIVHVLRHRRQIERFILKMGTL